MGIKIYWKHFILLLYTFQIQRSTYLSFVHFKISNSVFNLEWCFGRNQRFSPHLRFYQAPMQLEHPQFLSVFEGSIAFQECRHFMAQQSPANSSRKEKAEEIPAPKASLPTRHYRHKRAKESVCL